MKMQFWSIGKQHESYVKAGIEEFSNRIAKYYSIHWKIIPPPKNTASLIEGELKKKEGSIVLSMLSKDDYLVSLDERGRSFDSKQLAGFIETRAGEGVKQMIFLIGGAYGIDETVIKRANLVWSLSLLTFPHQLVRLILAEQVYRACTISRNEKYHHA